MRIADRRWRRFPLVIAGECRRWPTPRPGSMPGTAATICTAVAEWRRGAIAATPTRSSTWARPISSGAACRSICRWRKAGTARPRCRGIRRPRTITGSRCSRTASASRGGAVAGKGRRARRTARATRARHDAVQRRRRAARLGARLCAASRSSAAGLPQGSQTLVRDGQIYPAGDQRQQGIALARQYEAEVERPVLPADRGRTSTPAMRVTRPAAGASYSPPGAAEGKPPVAVAKPPTKQPLSRVSPAAAPRTVGARRRHRAAGASSSARSATPTTRAACGRRSAAASPGASRASSRPAR